MMPFNKYIRKLLKRNLTVRDEAELSADAFKKAFRDIKSIFRFKIVKIILIALLIIVLAPIAIFIAFRPTTQDKIEYGITFSNKYAQDLGQNWQDTYIKIMDDLGAKNLRLVAYWDEIEPEPGKYDYSKIKWQLDEAKKRNVKVILTVGRKVPRYPECFEPKWWKSLKDQNTKNEILYEYVQNTVTELKGYDNIKMWQVENEPFFPFGECDKSDYFVVKKEAELVRQIDKRPIMIQDSGEGGFWLPTYMIGDYLGISMYRKIWYDFWGIFFGKPIYFQYPLAHWTYHIKARMLGIDPKRVVVTELQGEPWGPGFVSQMAKSEKDKTMSEELFYETLNYAQKAGFTEYYVWGAEWWLWEKESNGNPFFWDTAKALFDRSGKL